MSPKYILKWMLIHRAVFKIRKGLQHVLSSCFRPCSGKCQFLRLYDALYDEELLPHQRPALYSKV